MPDKNRRRLGPNDNILWGGQTAMAGGGGSNDMYIW